MGNRSDGLVAVTPVPGIGGSEISGGTTSPPEPAEVSLVELELEPAGAVDEATVSVAFEESDKSPVAVTLAVSSMLVPVGAAEVTGTEASSS